MSESPKNAFGLALQSKRGLGDLKGRLVAEEGGLLLAIYTFTPLKQVHNPGLAHPDWDLAEDAPNRPK